jgi:NAD(P)-dependent dehydrogenase (short-subunit alcohol dehydrogenase family)
MNFGQQIKLLGKIGEVLTTHKTYLVFGSNGSIGSRCVEQLQNFGVVLKGSRDPLKFDFELEQVSLISGVIWAQGINSTDSVTGFNVLDFNKVIEANVTFILSTTRKLLESQKLSNDAQLVIVSSMWSQLSRPNKLAYSISKTALLGVIRSLAIDLGESGIQVNAVAPGPIDTPMTRENLSTQELNRLVSETPIKRLVTLDEVVSTLCAFVTGQMSGISGQEIVIDGGWGVSKLV